MKLDGVKEKRGEKEKGENPNVFKLSSCEKMV
jgi:hypothetical protein